MLIFAAQIINRYHNKMKKTFIALVAFLAISTTTMASMKMDSVRYLSSTMKQNWFISVDGSVDWWKGSDMYSAGKYDAVQWGKPSFGAGLSFGKWITHNVGVRLAYDVNGGKSYIDGLHVKLPYLNFLFDGKFEYDENGNWVSYTPNSENGEPDANGYYNTSFIYHNLHVDAMLSPIDLFQGYYNPNRVYTPVIFVGMGLATVSNNILFTPDFFYNSNLNEGDPDYRFKVRPLNHELSVTAGLINNFRLSNVIDLHLDLKWAGQRWNIDSWFNESGHSGNGWFYPDGTQAPGNVANEEGQMPTYVGRHRMDHNFSVALGLTFNINREYELPVNCAEEIEGLRKRLALCEEQMANTTVPVGTGDNPCDTIKVTEYVTIQDHDIVSYPFSIFFNKDSYQLMSRRDIVNLKEIAEVAKKNGYKIRLRGSCDSATASAAYNQKLSENRCRKIMMELMELGIPEDQIVLLPVGGVQELDPTEFDRRVLVELLKEAPKP